MGNPRNLQNPLVSSLNPEGVYVWTACCLPAFSQLYPAQHDSGGAWEHLHDGDSGFPLCQGYRLSLSPSLSPSPPSLLSSGLTLLPQRLATGAAMVVILYWDIIVIWSKRNCQIHCKIQNVVKLWKNQDIVQGFDFVQHSVMKSPCAILRSTLFLICWFCQSLCTAEAKLLKMFVFVIYRWHTQSYHPTGVTRQL